MPIIQIQRRMMELGRVRLGEKGPKGEPKRLNTFRFTSASKKLLEAVAEKHGGKVAEWTGAPDEGYFQVTTDATSLDIVLPPVYSDADGSPTLPYSQWFEMWSAGGCQRRCDGETEALSGKACMCDADLRKVGDPSQCKVVTRVSFMLPDVPGLGVWRIDSHGWNAAVELPGTLEVLAAAAWEQRFIPAVLSIQHRNRKVDGQTRRYIVPVIELPDVTIKQLAAGEAPLAINAPTMERLPRPELPAGAEPPVDARFEQDKTAHPGWGEQPEPPVADGKTVEELTVELIGVAEKARKKTAMQNAIKANRIAHEDNPDKHREWLERQLARADEWAVPA